MEIKKDLEKSVLVDPVEDDPGFQEKILKDMKKHIEKTNSGLHSVMEKYKNLHKEEDAN